MKGIGATALSAVTVLLVAMFGTGCGGGDQATSAALPASPTGKVEAASFDGIHSGEVEVGLSVARDKKDKPEEINMKVLGTFIRAEEPLPQLDLAIESRGDLAGHNVEFLSGPLLRPEKWIVNFESQVYEPDHATYKELKSKFEDAQREEGGEGNAMACVEAAEGVEVADFIRHLSVEGKGESLDGVKVVNLNATLDLPAVIGEAIKLTEESPGCKAQLEAVGLPPAAELEELEREMQGHLAGSELTLSLDKHGVIRSLEVLVNVELPQNEKLEVEFTVRLGRVNEVTELANTHGYSPYPALLKQFGLNKQDVKQADAGEIYVGILEVLADHMSGRESG